MNTSQKIVWAGLLVSAPRLVLAFLQGDGIAINATVEVGIFVATGIGSATVLTLGNGLIAHALSKNIRVNSPLWWFNLVAWVLFLLSAVILISPTLVAGLNKSQLNDVLNPMWKWIWSITAVAIVELLVAAVVSSSMLESQVDELVVAKEVAKEVEPIAPTSESSALISESIAPTSADTSEINTDIAPIPQLDERQQQVIDAIRNGSATVYAISKATGIAQTTLKRGDKGVLPAMVQLGALRNGDGTYKPAMAGD